MAKPTHILKIMPKEGKVSNLRAGVGWATEDGWIQIQLDPCVVISWKDDVYINLYPIDL